MPLEGSRPLHQKRTFGAPHKNWNRRAKREPELGSSSTTDCATVFSRLKVLSGESPMRSISVILAVSVSLALQGCAATEGIEPTDLSTVKAGASRADVEAVLGSPVETVKSDADEQYTVITYAYNRGAAGDPNLMPTCPKDAHYTCGAMLLLVLPFVVPMAVGESQEVYAEQRGHLYVTYDQAQRVRLVETKEHRNLVMAAEQGDIEAAYKLSQYALFMNAASRWRWLCLAAHGGHAQAQLLVADY